MTKSTKGLRSRLFGGQIWFPEGFRLGAKFGSLRGLDWGANGYIEALRDNLIPRMRQVLAQNRGDVPWILQQDSAPAHRQKNQEFLKEGVNFWPPA